MNRINTHKLAVDITLEEGGKISQPIGQVKEFLKIARRKLAGYPRSAVMLWLEESEAKPVKGEVKR